MSASASRLKLLHQYLAAWPKLNGFRIIENLNDRAKESSTEVSGTHLLEAFWQPLECKTAPEHLEPVYAKLPARFPPLYEDLVLNYRWPDADLDFYTLLGNPIGPDLSRFLAIILGRDKFMNPFLLKNGFIPFAKGADIDYDPVCFDLKSSGKNRELGIVKLDHEEILCNERIKVVGRIARSFEDLVRKTIAAAELI